MKMFKKAIFLFFVLGTHLSPISSDGTSNETSIVSNEKISGDGFNGTNDKNTSYEYMEEYEDSNNSSNGTLRRTTWSPGDELFPDKSKTKKNSFDIHNIPKEIDGGEDKPGVNIGVMGSIQIPEDSFTCEKPEADEAKCQNGGKCALLMIKDKQFVTCWCKNGYMGPKCEKKEKPETSTVVAYTLVPVFILFALTFVAFYFYLIKLKAAVRPITKPSAKHMAE